MGSSREFTLFICETHVILQKETLYPLGQEVGAWDNGVFTMTGGLMNERSKLTSNNHALCS